VRLRNHTAVVPNVSGRSTTSMPPSKPPTPPSIHQYMGQHYTHRERMKNSPVQAPARIEFNYIHPDDRDLFCLSVTDCLVKA